MKKILAVIIGIVILGLFSFWMYKELSKPLPGIHFDDLGREHIDDIADIAYNSNPPTSGKHFPIWAKKGIYDRMISDGYMIHSLEHGYVVISYDCTQLKTANHLFLKEILAHDEEAETSTDSGKLLMHMKLKQEDGMSSFTPDNAPEEEVKLPEVFASDACKQLRDKLSNHVASWERVIVTPRLGLSSPIAITAWTRLLMLGSVEDPKIAEFIRTYHNKGPEKTVE